ncbi:MAG: hypothetical protein JXB23_12285, partial [Candidatus Aminicenantes bacterium]|nr:hypothetical protein [Candidatus Aminicenantes bacterium]
MAQFAASIAFIIVTIVVSSQLNYVRKKNLGFEKEHVVIIPIYDKVVFEKREIVIGVVKDFHFRSLHQKIEPVALLIYPKGFENFLIRILPDDVRRTLEYLKNSWEKLFPGQP